MRKRTTNSKAANASQSSNGGSKSFRKSNDSSSRPFKKARPEAESRFSKPSIKKSSLRPSSPSSENQGPKARPNFDHEKPRTEKPRFDKPEFKRYASDKPRPDRSRSFGERDASGPARDRDFKKPDFEKGPRSFKSRDDFNPRDRKPFAPRTDRPEQDRNSTFRPRTERPDQDRNSSFKPRNERPEQDRSSSFRPRAERPDRENNGDFRPRTERPDRENNRDFRPRTDNRRDDRPFTKDRPDFKSRTDRDQTQERGPSREPGKTPDSNTEDRSGLDRRVGRFESAPRYNLSDYEKKNASKKKDDAQEIRLNRYIANAGICSRREADDLIASGQISVNGKPITEMGYKVKHSDVVKFGKKALNPEKMVYILINKPKDYITTTDDPEERKTVIDLIKGACPERVYPVGRLDRNTTGLLLMTNDGELAEKLTHPSSGIKKIYQAELDKPITTEDFELLQHGVDLEDGFIRPDEVGIVTPDAMVVGLEIHSGRNRIVRRMFEHLGYEVQKLDRTVFAGLNKKDLPRGKWRFLSEKEVIKLKYML